MVTDEPKYLIELAGHVPRIIDGECYMSTRGIVKAYTQLAAAVINGKRVKVFMLNSTPYVIATISEQSPERSTPTQRLILILRFGPECETATKADPLRVTEVSVADGWPAAKLVTLVNRVLVDHGYQIK